MAESKKNPPQIPMRVILTAPFILQIALIVGLVGYLSFHNGKQAVNEVALQLRNEMTSRIEEHLGDFLKIPHRINQTNANALRLGLLDANDPVAMERYFWNQIQIYDSISSIYFGNSSGGLVDAGREGEAGPLYLISTEGFTRGRFDKFATDENGNPTELLATIPDFDARTRGWYSQAIEKGKAAWSEVYPLFTGQDMAISASLPVYDQAGNLLGVVASDIFLSQINDFLGGLQLGRNGESFILERSGLLVASSTGDSLALASEDDQPPRRIYASESSQPLIRSAAEFLLQQFENYGSISIRENLEYRIDDRPYFLQVLPVRDDYGIDWLLVVVIPESDFMTKINTNSTITSILIVCAMAISVIVGIITSQFINEPISRLYRSTQELAEGNWDQTIPPGRIDEINELAQSFNQMAARLNQTVENLTDEIDAREKIEQSLRESERRFWEMLENVELIAVMLDIDGKVIYCNNYLLHLIDWHRDEVLGEDWFERYTPEEIREDLKVSVFDKMIAEEVVKYHYINEIQTRSGERRLISWNTTLFRDPQGHIMGATSLGEDITERIRAEKELLRRNRELTTLAKISQHVLQYRQAEELFSFIVAEIIEAIPSVEAASLWEYDKERDELVPIVWQGYEGEVDAGFDFLPENTIVPLIYKTGQPRRVDPNANLAFNEKMDQLELKDSRSILGVPLIIRDQVIGIIFVVNFSGKEEFSGADTRQLEAIANQVALTLENIHLFDQIKEYAGELEQRVAERTRELAQRVDEVDQLNRGMVNLVEDLQKANQRANNAARRQASLNRDLEAFAYSVSHDLSAPLRSISGFSQILAERHRETLNDQGKEYLDYVVQASGQMEALIGDLLDYARFGRRAVHPVPVNCEPMCKEILQGLKEQIENAKAEISLPESFPIILGDRTALIQIFRNLVENAIKYHKVGEPPKIEISWQTEGRYATIRVQDHGLGIPPEHHAIIFNMFQRLHSDADIPGSGIGLALAKKGVSLLNGEIGVDSQPGEGSTFWVKLPLADGGQSDE